eukprot:1406944-Pyramimonas_sp.AAC.1
MHVKKSTVDCWRLSTVGRRSSQRVESWLEGPTKSRQSVGELYEKSTVSRGAFSGPISGLVREFSTGRINWTIISSFEPKIMLTNSANSPA